MTTSSKACYLLPQIVDNLRTIGTHSATWKCVMFQCLAKFPKFCNILKHTCPAFGHPSPDFVAIMSASRSSVVSDVNIESTQHLICIWPLWLSAVYPLLLSQSQMTAFFFWLGPCSIHCAYFLWCVYTLIHWCSL